MQHKPIKNAKPAKTIIAQATSAEHQELRGKTMECVALIGEAVGRERFLADAKEVLEMMLTVQANAQTSSAANDPGLEYIIKASSRICRAIGDAFVPYLQYVIPGLLAKAACCLRVRSGRNVLAELTPFPK